MKEISYLVISDIHIGHKINTADSIYRSFISYFKDLSPYFDGPNGIKAIFIAGDLFDRFLPSYSEEYLIANKLLVYLVKFCIKHNLVLRVLEGTPLHDWGQARMFSEIIKELDVDVDFKYINDLTIEKIDKLNLTVLYIPDEYKHKAKDTYKDVLLKLKENNISKVDICVMHGAFEYQIPMLSPEIAHSRKDYEDITNYNIHIGHVHTHSKRGKVIAQGSFDRLAHGEEEPKGAIVNTINFKTNTNNFVFIENKRAMTFKTIKIEDTDIKKITATLKQNLKHVLKGSSIRIICKDKESVVSVLESISPTFFKDYVVKILLDTDDKSKKELLDVVEDKNAVIDTFSITRDNIIKLVTESLKETNTPEHIEVKAISLLKSIVSK